MKAHGLKISVKILPVLDTGFIPMAAFCGDFEKPTENSSEIATTGFPQL